MMTASAAETILASLLAKDEKSFGVMYIDFMTCSWVNILCYRWISPCVRVVNLRWCNGNGPAYI